MRGTHSYLGRNRRTAPRPRTRSRARGGRGASGWFPVRVGETERDPRWRRAGGSTEIAGVAAKPRRRKGEDEKKKNKEEEDSFVARDEHEAFVRSPEFWRKCGAVRWVGLVSGFRFIEATGVRRQTGWVGGWVRSWALGSWWFQVSDETTATWAGAVGKRLCLRVKLPEMLYDGIRVLSCVPSLSKKIAGRSQS